MIKSEKLKSILKGVWEFFSYLFWPRWGRSHRYVCKSHRNKGNSRNLVIIDDL